MWSDLDISGGQSGSNVWDSGFFTRALVNAGNSVTGQALHRTMTRSVFDWVFAQSRVSLGMGLEAQEPSLTSQPQLTGRQPCLVTPD